MGRLCPLGITAIVHAPGARRGPGPALEEYPQIARAGRAESIGDVAHIRSDHTPRTWQTRRRSSSTPLRKPTRVTARSHARPRHAESHSLTLGHHRTPPPTRLYNASNKQKIIRAGTPEYLRLIERGTLRTYGQYATPLSAFCSALLCTLMYPLWWYIGKAFATTRFVKNI